MQESLFYSYLEAVKSKDKRYTPKQLQDIADKIIDELDWKIKKDMDDWQDDALGIIEVEYAITSQKTQEKIMDIINDYAVQFFK